METTVIKNPKTIKKKETKPKALKKCPLGGYCFNPICVFGCVEN